MFIIYHRQREEGTARPEEMQRKDVHDILTKSWGLIITDAAPQDRVLKDDKKYIAYDGKGTWTLLPAGIEHCESAGYPKVRLVFCEVWGKYVP